MRYVAIVNTPGYLPEGTEPPPTFATAAEAWWYLYHERVNHEQDNECDLCHDTMSHGPSGDCDEDSDTGRELGRRARWAGRGLVTGSEACGTVNGPTPGYRGDHDLGLVYQVAEVSAVVHREANDHGGTVCGLRFGGPGWGDGDEAVTDPEERGDVTCPRCKVTCTHCGGDPLDGDHFLYNGKSLCMNVKDSQRDIHSSEVQKGAH